MAETSPERAQYQTDHDILIELRTEMRLLRQTIDKAADGTQTKIDDHESDSASSSDGCGSRSEHSASSSSSSLSYRKAAFISDDIIHSYETCPCVSGKPHR